MGTTGPASTQPGDRQALGPRPSRSSPSATWCGRRRCWSTTLGIETLFCVAGGSMGGMQVLQWAASYPEPRVLGAADRRPARKHSAQNIAFHEVGRQAMMADPDWRGGRYLEEGTRPRKASPSRAWPRTSPISRKPRCTGSSAASCRTASAPTFGFDADFQVESYLRHQGLSFVDRFDANSYLYITARDGLFRPRRRASAACWRAPSTGTKNASAWSPSPATGCSRPRTAAPSCMR